MKNCLILLCSCECARLGPKHVEAFDEITPNIFGCKVEVCGARVIHHPAHDETECLEYK